MSRLEAGKMQICCSSCAYDRPAGLKDTLLQAMEEFEARKARHLPQAMSFSMVGSTEARRIYTSLGIFVEDGNETAPLVEPEGGYINCGYFDMAAYHGEEAATGDFLAHIQRCLGLQGVVFGRSGFKVLDLHKDSAFYDLQVDDAVFKGGLDGGIVPYGVAKFGAHRQLRCGIEIKHSGHHKLLFRERQGEPFSGQGEATTFTGRVEGQAMIETLAACVHSDYPRVMLLLSSYDFNAVLNLSGGVLTYWADIAFDAAMCKMGEFLKECDPDRRFLWDPAKLPAAEAEAVERLRKRLRHDDVLQEQLESLTSGMDCNEKFTTALEFVQAYMPMSSAAEAMFG